MRGFILPVGKAPPAKLPPPRRGQYDWMVEGTKPSAGTSAPPPPVPPERGGGSPRVRVEIEIVQRKSFPSTGTRTGRIAAVLWASIATILAISLAGCAQAETFSTHRLGSTSYTEGSDGTRAQSYDLGSSTFTDIQRRDGSTTRCRSFMLGSTRQTTCD